MAKKLQNEPGTTPEEMSSTATVEPPRATVPAKGPVWTREFGRVKAAIWPSDSTHARPSISICREYIDWKNKEVKRVHYFDKDDLNGLRDAAREALAFLEESETV